MKGPVIAVMMAVVAAMSGCVDDEEPLAAESATSTWFQPEPRIVEAPFESALAVDVVVQGIVLTGAGGYGLASFEVSREEAGANMTMEATWTCAMVVPCDLQLVVGQEGSRVAEYVGSSPATLEATDLRPGEYVVVPFAPRPGAVALLEGAVEITLTFPPREVVADEGVRTAE